MQAEAAMQQDLSADNADPDPLLLDLRGVPDCSQLKEVFTEAVNVDSPSKDIKADFAEGAMEIPKNLHHALANLQPGVCENDICDSLFRLAMYLRHWRGGCDRMWIKNPRICRNRCGEQLNWYQFLVGAVGCYGMLVLYGLVMFCFSLLFFVLLLFFSSFSFIFSIKSTCNENVVCDGSNSGIFNDFIVMAWAVTQSSLPENWLWQYFFMNLLDTFDIYWILLIIILSAYANPIQPYKISFFSMCSVCLRKYWWHYDFIDLFVLLGDLV